MNDADDNVSMQCVRVVVSVLLVSVVVCWHGRLVDYLQNRSVGYQLQDLSCRKCKSIKDDNLRQYCECSGNFRCANETPASMEALLKVRPRTSVADA